MRRYKLNLIPAMVLAAILAACAPQTVRDVNPIKDYENPPATLALSRAANGVTVAFASGKTATEATVLTVNGYTLASADKRCTPEEKSGLRYLTCKLGVVPAGTAAAPVVVTGDAVSAEAHFYRAATGPRPILVFGVVQR